MKKIIVPRWSFVFDADGLSPRNFKHLGIVNYGLHKPSRGIIKREIYLNLPIRRRELIS